MRNWWKDSEWTNNTNSMYPQYSANYSNGYNISSDKLQRHHVNSNGKIELDESLEYGARIDSILKEIMPKDGDK